MSRLAAEVRRRLAAEFDRLGWTYDLQAGNSIAKAVEKSRKIEPAELAKLVSPRSLTRTTVPRSAIAGAIARALSGIDVTILEDRTELAMRILFVAAGPQDEGRLRLDAEHRAIRQAIQASSYRDMIHMESALAARPDDLIDELNRFKPSILHVSGHGGPSGIALEDADGFAKDISTGDLAALVAIADPALRLVVLNTCESVHQAKPAVKHVDAAIGMTQEIGDNAARVFATQLYSSLAEGVELSRAVDQAKLAMKLDGIGEEHTPTLFTRRGVNPSGIRIAGASQHPSR